MPNWLPISSAREERERERERETGYILAKSAKGRQLSVSGPIVGGQGGGTPYFGRSSSTGGKSSEKWSQNPIISASLPFLGPKKNGDGTFGLGGGGPGGVQKLYPRVPCGASERERKRERERERERERRVTVFWCPRGTIMEPWEKRQ